MLAYRLPLALLLAAPALLFGGGQPSTTALTSTPNPSKVGQNVIITATVTTYPEAATGTVEIMDGNTDLGPTTSLVNGVGTLSLTTLSAGVHNLTGTYGGSGYVNASLPSPVYEQTVAPVVALTSSASPATYGHSVTLTATISSPTATGKITFYDGAAVLGTSTINGGAATLTTLLITPGTSSLSAYYEGDVNFAPSLSMALPQSMTSSAGGGFQPAVAYGVGQQPNAMILADLNGDGRMDLVTGNNDGSVGIRLGNSDGTFQAATNIIVSFVVTSVVVSDFNGDGIPDLAVTDQVEDEVYVLMGVGDGTFTGAAANGVGTSPQSVVAGDFNGDGFVDLAVVNNGDNTVSILLGKGDGTFHAEVEYAAGSTPVAAVVGDFNDDGIADLAVTNQNGISVLLGAGDGTFAAAVAYSAGISGGITTGYFNSDAYLDLAVASPNDGIVSVLLGAGDGTFSSPMNYAAGTAPMWVSVADFDGDGKLDLAVSDNENSTINLLYGDGTGAFSAGSTYAVGAGPVATGIGDFNGDGVVDIASVNQVDQNVSVLLANSPLPATTTTLTSSLNPSYAGQSITLTATVSSNTAVGTMTFKDGSTTLTSSATVTAGVATYTTSALSGTSHSLTAVYSGDTNNAGSTSTVLTQVVNPQTMTTTTLSTSPNPSIYTAPITFSATVSPSSATGSVQFFDGLTSLGSSDLSSGSASLVVSTLAAGPHSLTAVYSGDTIDATSTSTSTSETVYPIIVSGLLTSSATPITYGHSVTLTFAMSPSTTTGKVSFYDGTTVLGTSPLVSGVATFTTATLPSGTQSLKAYYLGDANDSSYLSPALAQTVNVLATNGFSPASNYAAGNVPLGVATGDFNQDGIGDIAVADVEGNAVIILLGVGDGTFQPGVSYNVGSNPISIAVGDFNADGHADLAVVNAGNNNVSVLFGAGDGTFGSGATYAVGISPFYIVAGDFNGDGIPDLATTSTQDHTISVLLATGTGTFSPQVTYSVANEPAYIAVGDFNEDGFADLAVTGDGGAVTVLLGSGTGTFATSATYGSGDGFTSSVAVADFNGDAHADLAVANESDNTVTIFTGSGTGTFTAAGTFATDPIPNGIVAGDLNGDGFVDLATSNIFGDVTVLLGDGTGNFGPAVNYGTTGGPFELALGSFTRGGQAGIAVAGENDVEVLIAAVNTTTTLTSSANPAIIGTGFTLTATMSPLTATGTVTFMNGMVVLGSGPVTLSSGVATLALPALPIGAYSVTAVYSGDLVDLTSTSSVLLENVTTIPTTTTLISSANPAVYGQGVTLTATVVPATATGTVTFQDGSALLYGPRSLVNGVATLSVESFASGPHTLTATYSGDGLNSSSVGTLAFEVNTCGTSVESSLFVDSNGGPQAVVVTSTAPACNWNASTTSSWIQLSEPGGVGSGVLTATLSPNNTGYPRTGAIAVGGETIAVTQRVTTQIFADVPPSNIYFDPANLLYAKQITSGCSTDPLDYCPNQNIPRWEMAVYVVRAVYGTTPFTTSQIPYFNDVPVGSFGFNYIQKMYELGITTGCGNGNFCPSATVPRDQMAIFVIRMRYGSSALFDYPSTPYFTDVTSSTFGFEWIQRLTLDSITTGCTNTTFCPTNPVTRGEMAVFVLLGGFNQLLPVGTPVISSISPAVITHGGPLGTYTITGLNTNFVDGVTTISPIPGVVVGAVTVNSPTSLTVQLTALSDATLQPVSVQAITGNPPGNEEAVLPNTLVIQ